VKRSIRTLRAIVSGALGNKPLNGGNAWSRLSWVLGLQQHGCEVLFIEQIAPESCVNAAGATCAFEDSVNLAYFQSTMADFGLEQSSALICGEGNQVWGLPLAELVARSRETQLLFNIGGHLTRQEIKHSVGCRLYYDDDPGFTQFWHAAGNSGPRLKGHDYYYTIGENIGARDCSIPVSDISWHHTRPPVVLDHWPAAPCCSFERFTTVASWRGAYGPVTHEGKTYGLKVHEFRRFLDMPRRTGVPFEIALQIYPGDQKDLDALLSRGWRVSDPKQEAGSPEAFRRYIRKSSAEFSAAQGVYVETNSGWFSDRTVRYLASGKPALVQETGFSRNYPVSKGLLAFRNLEEAVEGAERITCDYEMHCRAARQIAEEYFDSSKVIRKMAGEISLELA
jgi:hypothetical protein